MKLVKKRNAFTLMELLGVIVILGMLLALAIVSYSNYLNSTKKKAFKVEEINFMDAAKSAYADCFSNNPNNEFCSYHKNFDTKYEYQFVYLSELVDNSYIREIKNPYDTDKLCNLDKSYVYVSRKNSAQSNNADMVYKTCLICGEHKSVDCLDENRDYSTFETTCTAYYDAIGGALYDGNWTDKNVYLSFGASGNYRYGIDEFEYTVGDSGNTKIDANSNDVASLTLNKNVNSKEYKVKAFDGINNTGTIASCGNIKIDKGTIDSVNITAKTASGTLVKSNSWAKEIVTLSANVSPSSSTSGYLYQWYKDGLKFGSSVTTSTLTVQDSGTYKVEVTNRVGKIVKTSNEFIVKIDTKKPTFKIVASDSVASESWHKADFEITASGADNISGNTYYHGTSSNPTVVGNTDTVSSNTSGTNYYYKVCSGAGLCTTSSYTAKLDKTYPILTAKSSSNYITTSTGAAITNYFNISNSISSGTTVCRVGTTNVSNTNNLPLGVNTVTCTTTSGSGLTASASTTFRHQYQAAYACSGGRTLSGTNCTYYYSNNESQCGCARYNSRRDSICGVEKYNTCQDAACGYNTCTSSCCGQTCDTKTATCSTNSTCQTLSSQGYHCVMSSGNNYYNCTKQTCTNKTCTNSCCSKKTCQNSACGVASYNSCESPQFGCQTASSCTKVENNYRYYTCNQTGNNGTTGSLSGSTCSF